MSYWIPCQNCGKELLQIGRGMCATSVAFEFALRV